MSSSDLQLYFCDLCSQSIAQSDIDTRRAVQVRGKWVCPVCCSSAPGFVAEPAPKIEAPRVTSGGSRVHFAHAGSASMVALALGLLAIAGVALVAYQSRRDVDQMRTAVARVDPAQANRVRNLQRRLDEFEASTRRWFDDAWANSVASLPQAPAPNASTRALDELAKSVADARVAVEELGLRDDEVHRELRAKLNVLEGRLAIAAIGNGGAVELTSSTPHELPPERKALLDRLRSGEPVVRAEALFELIARKDPSDVPFVAALLRDPDPFVRAAAARHLELVSAKAAVGALLDALEDSDSTVRMAADSALRGITGELVRFDPFGSADVRADGVQAWREWWSASWKRFLFGEPAGR